MKSNIESEGVRYVCTTGTTYCFDFRRPDKILLNLEFNDVDMDLDVFGTVRSKDGGKIPARDMQINSLQEGG